MGDGGSRDGHRPCGSVLELVGTNVDGCAGYCKSGGLESSDLGFAWGRRMRVYVLKTGATSRRSGSTT